MLPMSRGYRDNLGIFPIYFHKNISSDPPSESSRGDGSNESSRNMFSLRNEKM